MDGKVDFVCCDFPSANRLTLHILAAVAEHERDMISARTKAGLAAARARGVRLGNRQNLRAAQAKGVHGNKVAADAFAARVLPMIRDVQQSGVTRLRGIAAALAARGVPTARGGQWTPCRSVQSCGVNGLMGVMWPLCFVAGNFERDAERAR
jgi:DNA invertase Pin-like site-specific DNA recombinase